MNRLPIARVAAGLCGLVLVVGAGACPADALPAPGQTPEQTLQQLLTSRDACLRSAPHFRRLGAAYLAAGQPDAAADAFERALLLEPDHPGTQLDYADALLRLGDAASAAPLLQQLLARPDLPAHLRPALLAQLDALAQAAPRWLHRWVVGAAVAADDNLNNAPLSSTLTLTLPQGSVELPVDGDFRRRSGVALHGQLQWTGLRPHGSALWVLQGELRHRHHSQTTLRYSQADVSAAWLQAPDAPRQWLVRAGATYLNWGGQALYQGARTTVQHQWRRGSACRAGLGPDWEQRHYPQSPTADGTYWGLGAHWQCTQGNHSWQLQARVGSDHPDDAVRAGGRYQQQELRALWQHASGPWRLSADYQLTAQQDATGYSPLLANGARRRQVRHALALEASAPIAQAGQGWRWYAAVELSRQHSNLQPFATARHAISLGLRREWE